MPSIIDEGSRKLSSMNGTVDVPDEYQITKTIESLEVCYSDSKNDGLWGHGTALTTSLPFLLTQLFVVLVLDRVLLSILKPLHQPRIVAHITCGILLGPAFFGESNFSRRYVMPYRSTMVLETFANLALLYYMFLVGLELDFSLILNCERKPLAFAISGTLLPLGIGFSLYFLALSKSQSFDARGSMFWAILLTSTNFPDLARVLADLKLLRTDIGRVAMSSAIITDLCSWLLLVLAISILNTSTKYYVVILSTAIFVLTSIFFFRPVLSWLIIRTSKANPSSAAHGDDHHEHYHAITDNHVSFILAGIILFGFLTDACGSHSIFGAFMFGVIMPRAAAAGANSSSSSNRSKNIKSAVIEKIDDFVTEILIPVFFYSNGLRSDVSFMLRDTHWTIVLMVVVVSCAAKIVSALLVSLVYKMPPREGLALGLLMNTKGVLALIILNTGRNVEALNNQSFPLMMLSLLFMSSLIQPILAYIYKHHHFINYTNRTIQKVGEDNEFRVLVCLHSTRNLSGILGLLNLSTIGAEATQLLSPLCLFSVHLMELNERANNTTAMLIVHDEFQSNRNKTTETGQIINAFENFKRKNVGVTAQTITAVSPYATMHEDICDLAEDKHVALIVLPFHQEVNPDGTMGDTNSTISDVNHSVLMNASCSVAILIDRSLGSKAQADSHQIAMLFIGGPDDREALAYAWRMAGHASVRLTVVRFSFGKDVLIHDEREKLIDDEYIYEFKFRTMQDHSITFVEKMVHDGQKLIAATRAMGDTYYLYVVGRGKGLNSPSTPELLDWSDCSDLGILGDTLGSSNFALDASVLVVQQYYGSTKNKEDDDSHEDE